MSIDAAGYQRTLGDELRRARKRRGWTRKDLQQHLRTEISLQTLATYELGTRQCSVVRFVELCIALGERPDELLARAHKRVYASLEQGKVQVNLRSLAEDGQPELNPFRRWAYNRLRESPGTRSELYLDVSALEQLAALCGLATVDLIDRLHKLQEGSGDRTTGRPDDRES